MEIYYQSQFLGTLPKSATATFYLACLELGMQVDRNDSLQQMHLSSGLAHTKINLASLQLNEAEVIQVFTDIEESLKSHDIQCLQGLSFEEECDMDVSITLTLKKDTVSISPSLKLIGNCTIHDAWCEVVRVECVKEGIRLELQESRDSLGRLHVIWNVPKSIEPTFLRELCEKVSHILTITILSYLQKKYGLSALALFPAEAFPLSSFLIMPSYNEQPESTDEVSLVDLNEEEAVSEASAPAPLITKIVPITEALAFFNYHVLLNQTGNQAAKVFGEFTIKNAGTTFLNNPHICFRMTPAGSIHLTGQILPPKTAQTLGIHTASGTRGWMYMKEDWYEEALETGEIWISPIQSLEIPPGDDMTIAGLQMKFLSLEEVKDVKVEAFVYFPEQDYRTAAVNKISIIQVAGAKTDME